MTAVLVKKSKYQNCDEFWKAESQKIKDSGYYIKIRHERLFWRPVEVKSHVSNTIFYDIDQKIMTKGEFCKMIQEGKVKTDGKGYRNTDYLLENNSGRTVLTIFKDEQEMATGIAKVHPNDHFVRKIGLSKALAEAKRNLR